MTNIAKHLLMLESLKFPQKEPERQREDDPAHVRLCGDERLKHNVHILQKFIKLKPSEIIEKLREVLKINDSEEQILFSNGDGDNIEVEYSVYLQHVLLEITSNTNFNSDAKEDLISMRHMHLCIKAVQDVSIFALRSQLHPLFLKTGVFTDDSTNITSSKSAPNITQLGMAIEFFTIILHIKQFHIANSMELVLRDYMAALLTLSLANYTNESSSTQSTYVQMKLDAIWLHISKVEYFRNILLLKNPGLPTEIQIQLHQQLVQKLLAKEGFTTLVATLHTRGANKSHGDLNDKRNFEAVANIVSLKGHSKRFQQNIIRQIFQFLNLCLLNEDMLDSMGAGLLALRKLYALSEDNQMQVKDILNTSLKKLSQPEDVLSGLILMEHNEFCLLILMLYNLFCTSTLECLPSTLLVNYLPMLFELFYNMPDMFAQKRQVSSLLIQCLNNRESPELQEIIEKLYSNNLDAKWQQLHPRIVIFPNDTNTTFNLKIAATDHKQESCISLAVPQLLMEESFHILTYRVFMMLVQLMSTIVEADIGTANEKTIGPLETEEALAAYFKTKHSVKVDMALSLRILISHEPLRVQISENAANFLQLMRNIITKRVENPRENTEFNDQIILIMLTLTQEMLEHAQISQDFSNFIPTLQKLQRLSANQLVKQYINSLIAFLNGDSEADTGNDATAFNTARQLVQSRESYLQVAGIEQLLGLLHRKDTVTLANTGVIIALALTMLKSKESYTFLNCVRLMVGLVNVVEAEVLEILSDEYLDNNADMDFRLVVGEAILKVGRELGPLCYKYKGELLNCFMQGARSNSNEFRMSAFANLAQLCRILTYQVHHFMQELLHLIDCELTTGTYVPSKRAAVMVLTELLTGMENLMDFEEMLLPIYRLLKAIEANERCDEKMRLHAATGLRALAEKCKKFMSPVQQMQKEIKILGINDKPASSLKMYISEIN